MKLPDRFSAGQANCGVDRVSDATGHGDAGDEDVAADRVEIDDENCIE